MKKILKYELKKEVEQSIPMPKGAQILCAQFQPCTGSAQMWALVDKNNETVDRYITAAVTGDYQGCDGQYIGTVQYDNGALVLHFFDGGEV